MGGFVFLCAIYTFICAINGLTENLSEAKSEEIDSREEGNGQYFQILAIKNANTN